jgi:hypothetical protein
MARTIRVFAYCGSLRKGSFNRMALRAAEELAPEGMSFESCDIGDIPLYNEDVRQQGFPAPVEKMRERIRAADAILFVTPEYNYSIPGVLKNAIDWASRPPDQPFAGKPAALMGATPSMLGTARAVSPPAGLRLSQHVSGEPAGGADRRGRQEVRLRWTADRRAHGQNDRPAHEGACGLDGPAEG